MFFVVFLLLLFIYFYSTRSDRILDKQDWEYLCINLGQDLIKGTLGV